MFVDDKGDVVRNDDGEDQSIQFEYGTVSYSVKSCSKISSKNNGDITGTYDVFKVKGDKAGTQLFEMFSQNVTAKTGNEVGLIRTGGSGKGTNYITSAQKHGSEPGGPALFDSQLKYGYIIRENTHSHFNTESPSSNDIVSNRQMLRKYTNDNTIRFKIYISTLDKYIFYNPQDEIYNKLLKK